MKTSSTNNGDLPRDDEISRIYAEAPQPTPPAAIDEAILASARRAVDAKPRAVGPFSRRWGVPFSVAAVVVLSVIVVTSSQRERFSVTTDALQATPEPARVVSGKITAETHAPALEQAPMSTAPAAAPLADQPAAKAVMKSQLKSDAARKERRRLVAPAAALAPVDALSERAEEVEPESQTGGSAAQPAMLPATGLLRNSAAPRASVTGDKERTAKEWLAHVRALITQGRRKEAIASLARFRRRFPNYPVPPTLGR